MSCKVAKKWLLSEELLTDEQMTWLEDHVDTCDACKALYDDVMIEELNKLYEPKKIDVTSQVMSRVKKKTKWHYAGIAVALLVTIIFNKQIIAFAERVPLIGDLIDYYSEEKSTAYVNEHGFPLYGFEKEVDGYTLVLEDIYQDKKSCDLKLALTKKGESITNYSYRYNSSFNHKVKMKTVDSSDPWQKVYVSGQFNDISFFEFKVEDQTIKFPMDDLKIEVPMYEEKTYQVASNHEGFQPISLEVHPGYMYLTLNMEGDENNLNDLALTDENGKRYYLRSSTLNENNQKVVALTPSIYYEDVTTLTVDDFKQDVATPITTFKDTDKYIDFSIGTAFYTFDLESKVTSWDIELAMLSNHLENPHGFKVSYYDQNGDVKNLTMPEELIEKQVKIPDFIEISVLAKALDLDYKTLDIKSGLVIKENYLALQRSEDTVNLKKDDLAVLLKSYGIDKNLDELYGTATEKAIAYDVLESWFGYKILSITSSEMIFESTDTSSHFPLGHQFKLDVALEFLHRKKQRKIFEEIIYPPKSFELTKGMITKVADEELKTIIANNDLLRQTAERLQDYLIDTFQCYVEVLNLEKMIKYIYNEVHIMLGTHSYTYKRLVYTDDQYINPSHELFIKGYIEKTFENVELKIKESSTN